MAVGIEVGVEDALIVGVGVFSVGEGDDIGVEEECGVGEGLEMFWTKKHH